MQANRISLPCTSWRSALGSAEVAQASNVCIRCCAQNATIRREGRFPVKNIMEQRCQQGRLCSQPRQVVLGVQRVYEEIAQRIRIAQAAMGRMCIPALRYDGGLKEPIANARRDLSTLINARTSLGDSSRSRTARCMSSGRSANRNRACRVAVSDDSAAALAEIVNREKFTSIVNPTTLFGPPSSAHCREQGKMPHFAENFRDLPRFPIRCCIHRADRRRSPRNTVANKLAGDISRRNSPRRTSTNGYRCRSPHGPTFQG